MSEIEPTKKRTQNKAKKKQSTKKVSVTSGKQSNSSKGAANIRSTDLNNGTSSQDKTSGSTYPSRTLNTTSNASYVSALGNSMVAPPVSISGGPASVYGYGGLPIAPPPNGNPGSFMSSSTHIPPAQRAGPYIPYFPQPCKPS